MAKALDIEKTYARLLQLHQQGRLDKARQIYQRILDQRPANPYALHLFGVTADRHRLHPLAVRLLSAAIQTGVEDAAFYAHLGLALRHHGQLDKALPYYEKALALNPDSAEILHNLGDLFQDQQRLDEAIQLYCRSLEIDSDSLDTYNNLGEALLKNGELEEALQMFDFCLQRQPGRVRALSLKTIALEKAGRSDELDQLVDFEKLVYARPATPLPPYTNLQDFNQQLAGYISHHPALTDDIPAISTRHGRQTRGNLLDDRHPLVETLKKIITARVHDYQAHIRQFPDHPHARVMPRQWRLEGWGVRLDNQGYQAAHVHYDGWNSCVYYVAIPNVVTAGDNKQGWIRFGEGPRDYYQGAPPAGFDVQPREGLLVMFPSWLWHQTLPFESEQARICIAADIIPLR